MIFRCYFCFTCIRYTFHCGSKSPFAFIATLSTMVSTLFFCFSSHHSKWAPAKCIAIQVHYMCAVQSGTVDCNKYSSVKLGESFQSILHEISGKSHWWLLFCGKNIEYSIHRTKHCQFVDWMRVVFVAMIVQTMVILCKTSKVTTYWSKATWFLWLGEYFYNHLYGALIPFQIAFTQPKRPIKYCGINRIQ